MERRNFSFVLLFLTLANIHRAIAQAPKTENRNNALKQTCLKNGGSPAFSDLERGEKEFNECTKQFYKTDAEFWKDMRELKPNGNQQAVVSKYCQRYPQLRKCLQNGIVYASHCLVKQEQEALEYMWKLFDNTATFSCQNGGKDLTSFLTDGRECVNENLPGLLYCAYKELKNYVAPIGLLPEDGYSLVKLGQIKCGEVDNFRKCAVEELKKCKSQTAAKFIQSVFDSNKKVPCDDKLKGN